MTGSLPFVLEDFEDFSEALDDLTEDKSEFDESQSDNKENMGSSLKERIFFIKLEQNWLKIFKNIIICLI